MVGAPAHLPGHSDGAPVALLAALERPGGIDIRIVIEFLTERADEKEDA